MDINKKIYAAFDSYISKPPFLGVIARKDYLDDIAKAAAKNAFKAGFISGNSNSLTQKEARLLALIVPSGALLAVTSAGLNPEENKELQEELAGILEKIKGMINE